jgi:hypothetical protein
LANTNSTIAKNNIEPAQTQKVIALKSHVIPISASRDAVLTLRNPTDNHFRDSQDHEVKYKVCSVTLRGSSSYFEAIFKHSFAEATPLADGMMHFEAENFHSRAMIILLKFIHGRHTRRALSLDDLGNIAIIVDYYGISIASLAKYSQGGSTYFQDAVVRLINGRVDSCDFFTIVPAGQHKRAMKLMFVIWVFGVSWLFKRLTSDHIDHARAPLQDFDLPISSVVLEINDIRRELIDFEGDVLFDLYGSVQSHDSNCPANYKLKSLAVVSKATHDVALMVNGGPTPLDSGFPGLSYTKVQKMVDDIGRKALPFSTYNATADGSLGDVYDQHNDECLIFWTKLFYRVTRPKHRDHGDNCLALESFASR